MKKSLIIVIAGIIICAVVALYFNQKEIAAGLTGSLPVLAYKVIDSIKQTP